MAKTAAVYTVRSTAVATGYCQRRIMELIYEEKITGALKAGGRWLIPAAAVEELKRKREVRNGTS